MDIFLRNSHDNFGPEKTKLKVQGNITYKYETIQKDFGLNYERLNADEKITLINSLLYSFNLTVFDKAVD